MDQSIKCVLSRFSIGQFVQHTFFFDWNHRKTRLNIWLHFFYFFFLGEYICERVTCVVKGIFRDNVHIKIVLFGSCSCLSSRVHINITFYSNQKSNKLSAPSTLSSLCFSFKTEWKREWNSERIISDLWTVFDKLMAILIVLNKSLQSYIYIIGGNRAWCWWQWWLRQRRQPTIMRVNEQWNDDLNESFTYNILYYFFCSFCRVASLSVTCTDNHQSYLNHW